MKFQLVLQFEAREMRQFDELVALEEKLIQTLSPASEVDGHDFGSDEFNIFVLTNEPREAFQSAQKLIQQTEFQKEFKAAYRDLGTDDFVIIWPNHLDQFRVS